MWRTIRSAVRLDRVARVQALEAAGWLAFVQLALWCLPYHRVRPAVSWIAAACRARSPLAAAQCTLAVQRGARVFPRTTCLARALAAGAMFARRGQPSIVTIGVARPGERLLRAHAWLEYDGLVVIGGAGTDGLSVLSREALGTRQ